MNVEKYLDELIGISRHYGNDPEYAIAGGGNTSFKTDDTLWIKASGTTLAALEKDALAVLDRKALDRISSAGYSRDPDVREQQVKSHLMAALKDPGGNRPSVETSLHNLINYRFVVHLHPSLINALLCSMDSAGLVRELFGDEAMYIPYTDPGYVLFKKTEEEMMAYRQRFGKDPEIIFLENHGVLVSADSTGEIRSAYDEMNAKIKRRLKQRADQTELPPDDRIETVLPAVRMMLSGEGPVILRYRHDKLVSHFYGSPEQFEKVAAPFTPDMMVYCKASFLYVDADGSPEELTGQLRKSIGNFNRERGYLPRVIMVRGFGLICSESDDRSASTVLEVYTDLMKISVHTQSFGGPRFMTPRQIAFIESWEVENYRRKLAMTGTSGSGVRNRIAIVTGGSQGFGAGIASGLFKEGANVVLADINEKTGRDKAKDLNTESGRNRAVFVRTDVSDPGSVASMVRTTVREFGGLDILVSNAGILHAGGLDEMDPATFEKMTAVNYHGFYLCTRSGARIMKIQESEKPGYATDIIQINSKSGLKGSRMNFAYAGAKFGGIGLVQSFALELVRHCIKVNAVCPGNFFDGPLWSDPEKGLFVQYLRAGKVPGAKTVEDVRRHYEAQVPMNRGCRTGDVMKAILYIIGQQYETGQAIPVTGGQIMLH